MPSTIGAVDVCPCPENDRVDSRRTGGGPCPDRSRPLARRCLARVRQPVGERAVDECIALGTIADAHDDDAQRERLDTGGRDANADSDPERATAGRLRAGRNTQACAVTSRHRRHGDILGMAVVNRIGRGRRLRRRRGEWRQLHPRAHSERRRCHGEVECVSGRVDHFLRHASDCGNFTDRRTVDRNPPL